MKNQLRSEYITRRLFWSMLVIIFSLLFICIPLTIDSYRTYKKTDLALTEISALRNMAELTNMISRERGPSNKVMSSTTEEFEQNFRELIDFRKSVDTHIAETVNILNKAGLSADAENVSKNVVHSLEQGRQAIDGYIAIPRSKRTSIQLDQSIQKMFAAWDSAHQVLKNVISHSMGKNTVISDYYTLILILTDLRDQAGRLASNIIAAVTFQEKIPEENLARSLQTQYQAYYLWDLINSIQQDKYRTPQYLRLHGEVKTEFLEKAIPMVKTLINESIKNQPYSMTGTQLTEQIVDKFLTVVNLQDFLLDHSVKTAEEVRSKAWKKFILTLSVSVISVFTAIFTMVYARYKVFTPLIRARNLILKLAGHQNARIQSSDILYPLSLFEAIQKLQAQLAERDVLELQLRNIANTDILTGVSNRLALDEHIQYLEKHVKQLSQTCLILVDIDYFKQVNDQYGHIIGDQIIQLVASQLKKSVRSSDLIIRYGGDEFIIFLEYVEFGAALKVAEKIRAEVQQAHLKLENGNSISVSVSIGVATGAENWLELLEKADQALFRAKAAGRNSVA